MKRKIFLVALLGMLLAGCFETTQEITINADGSGIISNTNDMSSLLGIVKQMGSKEGEKLGEEKMDTTMALAPMADSISGLSEQEKEMMKVGTMDVHMDLKEEKFVTTMKFPFSSLKQIPAYNQLAAKVASQALKDKMGDKAGVTDLNDSASVSSFEDYCETTFAKGLITKKLNKEKYANAPNDEYLKAMKESSGMGIVMQSTYIINLPKPAKKVEGKNVQLSEDKKKVTVHVDINDFFDDPSKMEYRIEY